MNYPTDMIVPEDRQTFLIMIESYEDKNPTGIYYHPFYGNGLHFANLQQLLQLIDDQLNNRENSVPHQRNPHYRKMPTEKERMEHRDNWMKNAPDKVLGIFRVKILCQYNGSWQGSVGWIERKREMHFRSSLELIQLIDSALPEDGTPNDSEETEA